MTCNEKQAPAKRKNGGTDLEASDGAHDSQSTQDSTTRNIPIQNTSGQTTSNEDNLPSSTQNRPGGRKAAKQDAAFLKNSNSLAESGRCLTETAKSKLMDSEGRTEALIRLANHAIMSVDLQNLSATSREFYVLEQA